MQMTIEYVLLILALAALFLKRKKIAHVMLKGAVAAAYGHSVIDGYGVLWSVCFYAITYLYFRHKIIHHYTRILLFLLIATATWCFLNHLLPGFKNPLIIDCVRVSPLSLPYSLYFNFDKMIAALILFMNSGLYRKERIVNKKAFITCCTTLFGCALVLLPLGLWSGYIQVDLKLPPILWVWSINNLFFVCFSEEVVFRGILYKQLKEWFPHKYMALALSSLMFGVYHWRGGLFYIFFSTIAGLFYGLTYQKTNKVLCAMLVHFTLNLIHILLFTYPASIKMIS